MDPPTRRTPRPAPPSGGVVGRFLRLHSFEFLIFVIMFVLLALCLAAAPLISANGPSEEERLVL